MDVSCQPGACESGTASALLPLTARADADRWSVAEYYSLSSVRGRSAPVVSDCGKHQMYAYSGSDERCAAIPATQSPVDP